MALVKEIPKSVQQNLFKEKTAFKMKGKISWSEAKAKMARGWKPNWTIIHITPEEIAVDFPVMPEDLEKKALWARLNIRSLNYHKNKYKNKLIKEQEIIPEGTDLWI